MSIINNTDQIKYTGKGYLDAKMQPVNTLGELINIPRAQRFIGLTVTVLDDGRGLGPVDYWLKESVTAWVIKNDGGCGVPLDGDDYTTT